MSKALAYGLCLPRHRNAMKNSTAPPLYGELGITIKQAVALARRGEIHHPSLKTYKSDIKLKYLHLNLNLNIVLVRVHI